MIHAHELCACLMRISDAYDLCAYLCKVTLLSSRERWHAHGCVGARARRQLGVDFVRRDGRTRGEDFYFTTRARPGDTPEVFARVLPAAVFRGATFARRRGLRPACAAAFGRALAPPAGG